MTLGRNIKVPRHVGIIPDGTRRWSKVHGVSLAQAYEKTMERLERVIRLAFLAGVESMSIYLLSRRNLEREQFELAPVLRAEESFITNLLPPLVDDLSIRVVHAGEDDSACQALVRKVRKLCDRSSSHSGRRLYLLINYDPSLEIQRTSAGGSFTRDSLWVPESVDLVVRTGGDYRLSDFLPLQSGYAELSFFPSLFNDVEADEIIQLINQFNVRERRHGK